MARASLTPSLCASDAEFCRRACLDLVGRIPSAVELRTFLADKSKGKRVTLIDQLLSGPEWARHMQTIFDVMLMERRPDQRVNGQEWQSFLYTSFRQNKSWDQLTREILAADGAEPDARAAAKFYLERDGDPHTLTRDVGRLFLGRNMQCAQCHDHPLVDDYPQEDYYGLQAFLSRTYLYTDPKSNIVSLGEKADGEVTFKSVFKKRKDSDHSTGPKLPSGAVLQETRSVVGNEYWVSPTNNARSIPKYSRRMQLGVSMTAGDRAYNQNIVNRLWAHMFGRGLVHPVDLHHDGNPASHPELLEVLGAWFASHGYDVRALLRELALSQTYQRSSEPLAGATVAPAESFAAYLLKPLRPEQLAMSVMQATGLRDAEMLAAIAEVRMRDLKFGAVLSNNATWLEATLHARLGGQVPQFVNKYGGAAGQPEEYQATMDQALFLTNGATVRSWLAPRDGNLSARILKLSDNAAVAEELYVSILSRMPSEVERLEVDRYLKLRYKERESGLQELAWALIASAEFRFNH